MCTMYRNKDVIVQGAYIQCEETILIMIFKKIHVVIFCNEWNPKQSSETVNEHNKNEIGKISLVFKKKKKKKLHIEI